MIVDLEMTEEDWAIDGEERVMMTDRGVVRNMNMIVCLLTA